MSTIGERIKNLRIKKGCTLEEVGKFIGVNRATVQRYESGIIPGIPSDKIELLANFFNVTPAYIMGWEDKRLIVFPEYETRNLGRHHIVDLTGLDVRGINAIEKKQIPLVGKIACGEPIETEESFAYYVEVGTDIRADFCVKCSGDSMYNARIYDGDIVFIAKQPDVENGEIAAVAIDDAITLKRVYKGPGYIELRAENPKYKPIIVREEDKKDVRIIGKAVAFQADVV